MESVLIFSVFWRILETGELSVGIWASNRTVIDKAVRRNDIRYKLFNNSQFNSKSLNSLFYCVKVACWAQFLKNHIPVLPRFENYGEARKTYLQARLTADNVRFFYYADPGAI